MTSDPERWLAPALRAPPPPLVLPYLPFCSRSAEKGCGLSEASRVPALSVQPGDLRQMAPCQTFNVRALNTHARGSVNCGISSKSQKC